MEKLQINNIGEDFVLRKDNNFRSEVQETMTNIVNLAFKLYGSNIEFLHNKIIQLRINNDWKLHFRLTQPINIQGMFTLRSEITFIYSSLCIFYSTSDFLTVENDELWISYINPKENYEQSCVRWKKQLNDLESFLLQKKLEIC